MSKQIKDACILLTVDAIKQCFLNFVGISPDVNFCCSHCSLNYFFRVFSCLFFKVRFLLGLQVCEFEKLGLCSSSVIRLLVGLLSLFSV